MRNTVRVLRFLDDLRELGAALLLVPRSEVHIVCHERIGKDGAERIPIRHGKVTQHETLGFKGEHVPHSFVGALSIR